MSNLAFDTLAYVKKLRSAGVPDEQAEAQAEAMADIVSEKLVTQPALDQALSLHESRVVKKVGALTVGSMTVLAGIVALLEFTH